MRYLTYGEVQKRAMAAGLVMSRSRMDCTIALRWRDPARGRKEWSKLGIHQADEIIRSIERDAKVEPRHRRAGDHPQPSM